MKKFNIVIFVLTLLTIIFGKAQSAIPQTLNKNTCLTNESSRGQTIEELGEKYNQYLLKVKEYVSGMPVDISVKFPLGVICPFRLGTPEENVNSPESNSQLQVIGFIERSGQPKAIAPTDLIEMFEMSLSTINTQNSRMNPQRQNILPADGSATPPQPQRVPAIDLIALDPQTNQIYLLPDVMFMSVFRDALNAALNKKLSPNDYDVTRLDPSQMRQTPWQIREI